MGNSNSGHGAPPQAPPLWTQSLPRDVHRQKKHGPMQGTKVLPERIPGQRLKPTENGRNLQVKGTISTRRITDLPCPPPGYPPPLANHHSSSMTALNHPPNHVSPQYLPTSPPVHNLRFGQTPSKSFTSEPDLRVSPPASHISLPVPSNGPHSIICDSPTKGKIKSKKRYKAPLPPPPVQASISLPLERSQYVPSPNMSMENWSSISSPPVKLSKSRQRKMGLFKKKSESRMSNYETEYSTMERKSRYKEHSHGEGKSKQKERSTTPVPILISSKKELKERARSLDNLQHEMRQGPQGLTNSLHSLEVIGKHEDERHWIDASHENHRRIENSNRRKNSTLEKNNPSEHKEKRDRRKNSSLEWDSRNLKKGNNIERRLHEKQLEERMPKVILTPPLNAQKLPRVVQSISSTEYHRSSSSCSSCKESNQKDEAKDEWDLAEEEWLQRKKKSENLQKEIIIAAKNLRKTSTSPEVVKETLITPIIHKEREISRIHISPESVKEPQTEDIPKTFFFGMEPEDPPKQDDYSPSKTALSKLNDQDEVKIVGSIVEYSRHSLRPREKKRTLERDSWNRSLDYREKTRSRSREKVLEEQLPKSEVKKKLSREVDEFAATIERVKLKQKTSDELSNSISRKGDGGYHSRQNSGSFHLETEGSDDDNTIRINLRPTLPRRQLELPRFSPNAAWRSLSVETTSRQKDVHSDVPIQEDVFSISEDQIHRYTRPTAPPRTSGEKSADSGISGDAGSPGPMQEFEPLTPEKIKTSSGPLAVSSPVNSARLDSKRAWTPAQDLDDNSFEENVEQNGKGNFHHEVSTMPKLTSRTNMFSSSTALNSPNEDLDNNNRSQEIDLYTEDNHLDKSYYENDKNNGYKIQAKSLQRVKKVSSSPRTQKILDGDSDDKNILDDSWRENWSMSRSIPNSLNTCDEPDCASTSSRPCRSRSESRMSMSQNSENRGHTPGMKSASTNFLQHSNGGHIMYLPQYKAYQMSKNDQEKRINNVSGQQRNSHFSSTYNEHFPTPEHERKPPSGDESPGEPETGRWNDPSFVPSNANDIPSRGNRFIVLNGKKGKKFSYQSTVRILEKKKLEEKLTKEVEEKEKRRKREIEVMMRVEQEFQNKREREKNRLKKQLQLFQQQQQHNRPKQEHTAHHEEGFFIQQPLDHSQIISYNSSEFEPPPPLPSSPPPFSGHRQMSYQSLPLEMVNNPYEQAERHQQSNSGLFSGFKKWVKGKKEPRSGYLSDASSATVTSFSRQEPDGAPASSPGRKNLDNIRAEIIAASKHRNGTPNLNREAQQERHKSRSPAQSVASKESQMRTITPDSKRAISPDSRKSISSDTCQLTQELSEMKQEHRQYREYRRSGHNALKHNAGHVRPNYKASPASHNYRRDFCLGNVSNSPMKFYQSYDDSDRNSRNSSESRKSKPSSSKRSSSVEMILDDNVPYSNSLRRQYSSPHSSKTSTVPVPIPPHQEHRNIGTSVIHPGGNHLPKGYQPPVITPYNPSKGYRPVSFTPPPGKILTVT